MEVGDRFIFGSEPGQSKDIFSKLPFGSVVKLISADKLFSTDLIGSYIMKTCDYSNYNTQDYGIAIYIPKENRNHLHFIGRSLGSVIGFEIEIMKIGDKYE